jgi:hypothetical protein
MYTQGNCLGVADKMLELKERFHMNTESTSF